MHGVRNLSYPGEESPPLYLIVPSLPARQIEPFIRMKDKILYQIQLKDSELCLQIHRTIIDLVIYLLLNPLYFENPLIKMSCTQYQTLGEEFDELGDVYYFSPIQIFISLESFLPFFFHSPTSLS